jgi:hypothetical protein
MEQKTQILRIQDNRLVDADLVSMADKHRQDFRQTWKAQLRASTQEDQFWDWEMKHRVYLANPNYEAYAIECQNMTQGLMLIETRQHRSWHAPNRPAIYVHSLATAPWNRPSPAEPGIYRAVGGTLLDFAQYRSEELGYGGCVGLHSLPGAEGFYRRMNMIECGEDEDRDNLIYFEWYRQTSPNIEEWDTLE